jgi:hypothetical protein
MRQERLCRPFAACIRDKPRTDCFADCWRSAIDVMKFGQVSWARDDGGPPVMFQADGPPGEVGIRVLRTRFDGGAIDGFIHAMENPVSPGCAIVTHEFCGAASRVAETATAFGLRRDHLLVEMLASFPDRSEPSDMPLHRNWTRATRERFAAALPGGYPNFLAKDELDRARKSYGGNAERLMEIKHRYDPDNVSLRPFRCRVSLSLKEQAC